MRGFGQDFRFALRSVRGRPLFRGIAVLILALGLGAAISVYTYLNGFRQPFPGADHDGLVRLFSADESDLFQDISFLDFEDYAVGNRSFDGLAAVQSYYAASVRLEEVTVVAFLDAVSGEYFQILGVEPALGRLLGPRDDGSEAEPAVVLSYEWWMSQFGGDRSVLGATVYLNYRPHTVVGVASSDFLGSASDSRPDVWIPISSFRDRYVNWDRLAQDRTVPLVRVFGRLGHGSSLEQAEEDLSALARSLDEEHPLQNGSRRVHLRKATWIDPRARLAEESTNRIMLYASVGFLLLVCANVANLLLSVHAARRKETALQAALGASRGRIIRVLLLENLLLSSAAGAVALIIAGPVSSRIGSYFSRPSVWGETVSREVSLDPGVFFFAVGISLLTGLVAGAVPALRAFSVDLHATLRSTDRQPGPRERFMGFRIPGVQDGLIAFQVSVSVVLLVVSGLVLRTLVAAGSVDPGFDFEHLIGSHISTSSTSIDPQDRERFFREVEERIAREPWVEAATVSGNAPLSGHGSMGVRVPTETEPLQAVVARVHDGFFETMGIDVLSGRGFERADSAGAPVVAVLNQPAAELFFPAEDPVSRQVWFPSDGGLDQPVTIVGVVGRTKVRDFLAPSEPTVYLHFAQQTYGSGSALLVRVRGMTDSAVASLHQWLRAFEPHLAIVNAVSYRDVVRGALYAQRMNAELFTLLAVLGLVLAAVGIVGVVSLSVTSRTREIGVRIAIGAGQRSVRRMVVGQALAPVLAGTVAGLGLSLAFARLVEGLLFGVGASDPVGVAGGVGVLLLTAWVAAHFPARRAAKVDPMKALRVD